MLAEQIRSNVSVAIDTLRANKLRSGLTILGVVIGVSTVMMMAAIVQGIHDQIVRTIEIAGPTTFYVMKVSSQTPVNPDRLPKWIRIRPNLTDDEARRIAELPEIEYAAIWGQTVGVSSTKASERRTSSINGADDRFVGDSGRRPASGSMVHAPGSRQRCAGCRVSTKTRRERLFGASQHDRQAGEGRRPSDDGDRHLPEAGEHLQPPGQADRAASCPTGCSTTSSRSTRRTRCSFR